MFLKLAKSNFDILPRDPTNSGTTVHCNPFPNPVYLTEQVEDHLARQGNPRTPLRRCDFPASRSRRSRATPNAHEARIAITFLCSSPKPQWHSHSRKLEVKRATCLCLSPFFSFYIFLFPPSTFERVQAASLCSNSLLERPDHRETTGNGQNISHRVNHIIVSHDGQVVKLSSVHRSVSPEVNRF